MQNLQKKKLVLLLPQLCVGGAERVQITLANSFAKEKHNVEFVALQDGPVHSWIDPSVRVHVLNKKRIRESLFSLYKKLKELQPDIIISSLIHMNMAALLLKPFFPKTKFIIRESSLPSMLMKEYGLKGYLCIFVYKFLYPQADIVISPCRIIIDEFQHKLHLHMKNHHVIFNPVDVEKILKNIDEKFEPPKHHEKTVHFICVGRLSFEKGFDRLINSLAKLNLPYEWRLDILGEGPERPKLEALIKRQELKKHVFLKGYDKNPWNQIARADYLILPSLWEGMPNVVLESLVCGTPVIGTRDAGGIVEISELAEKGAVQIAQTIDDLIGLMNKAQPNPKTIKAPSMLPQEFLLENVMKNLKGLLTSL